MPRERRLDERLRQREADLPEIFRVRAQDDDFFGGKPCRDDQPIEVIVLHLAAKHKAERVGEHAVQCVDLHFRLPPGNEQAQVVHPYGWQPVGRDPVRPLIEDLEAHVLQHRQAVGERHRPAAAEQLEAQRARRGFQRTIQRHAQRLRVGEPRHHLDVGHGGTRLEVLAVAGRECRAELPEQRVAARLAQRLDERVLEIVLPAPRRCDQAHFQRVHVVLRNAPRRRAHGDHHPRERRLRKMNVELGAAAVEGLRQNCLPLLAQLGRVIFARRVDQAGEEALEGVAANEEAQPLPVLEMEDRL